MADYNYGSEAGSNYYHALSGVGRDIARGIQQYQKQRDEAKAAQGMLDLAKRFQLPDAKTGKPKNVFQDDHIQYIQRLIDQHDYKAAGAAEAAVGIGKGMFDRYNTAAAKQQDAYQKAQDLANRQQRSLQGPYQMIDAQGNKYRGNLNDKGVVQWFPDTSVPRNSMGLSAKDQFQLQRGAVNDANKAQQAQFKADQQAKIAQNNQFSALLKGAGIKSPTDLFDPSVQQGGTYTPGTGFVSLRTPEGLKGNTPETPDPQGRNMTDVSFANDQADVGNLTHVKFYSDPAPPKGQKEDQPKLTPVIPLPDLIQMQNAAAKMAGPSAVQALQWMRDNPDSEHAEGVRKEIIARTSEATKAPDPATFQPTAPSFAPPSAPSQPYTQQPDVSSGVSDEAAAQNPGY